MLHLTTSSLAALLPLLLLTLPAPLASASATASPSVSVPESFLSTLRTPRPIHAASSPARTRTCVAESHNDPQTDDASLILSAIHACNNSGHVLFAQKQTYTIATPLNLTSLAHIDLDIQGTLSFSSSNLSHWQSHAFNLHYQNATSFLLLGGHDINVYGAGTLHGNGQAWWDAFALDKKVKRPVLFAVVGMHGGSISGIKQRAAPFWHNVVVNSSDVVYSGMDLWSTSGNGNFEKNTDGWDVYRSERVVIENSTVTNGDDCVSLKPNASSILIQNLYCNGSHGISIGSLGQYPSRIDLVTDILVRNTTLINSSEGARIKIWPDAYAEKSSSLTGGGGAGLVRNVTFDGMRLDNVDYGITITQCYGQDDEDECFRHPSKLRIEDVLFRDVRGRSNRVFAPLVGHVVCSSVEACEGVRAEGVDIRSVNGSNLVTCRNVDEGMLGGLNCTGWSKGYNPA